MKARAEFTEQGSFEMRQHVVTWEIPFTSWPVLEILFGKEVIREVRENLDAIDNWENEGGAL